MRKNQYEIDEIWRVFRDEGVVLPEDLLTSSIINDRLEYLLETLADMAYENGRFDCSCEEDW